MCFLNSAPPLNMLNFNYDWTHLSLLNGKAVKINLIEAINYKLDCNHSFEKFVESFHCKSITTDWNEDSLHNVYQYLLIFRDPFVSRFPNIINGVSFKSIELTIECMHCLAFFVGKMIKLDENDAQRKENEREQ